MPSTETTTAPATFQVGTTYAARSACDSNCVWTFEVIKRTAKRITIAGDDTVKTIGVRVGFGGHEYASPLGTYSMAPVICADLAA
jgi:hypothetical protein